MCYKLISGEQYFHTVDPRPSTSSSCITKRGSMYSRYISVCASDCTRPFSTAVDTAEYRQTRYVLRVEVENVKLFHYSKGPIYFKFVFLVLHTISQVSLPGQSSHTPGASTFPSLALSLPSSPQITSPPPFALGTRRIRPHRLDISLPRNHGT